MKDQEIALIGFIVVLIVGMGYRIYKSRKAKAAKTKIPANTVKKTTCFHRLLLSGAVSSRISKAVESLRDSSLR